MWPRGEVRSGLWCLATNLHRENLGGGGLGEFWWVLLAGRHLNSVQFVPLPWHFGTSSIMVL